MTLLLSDTWPQSPSMRSRAKFANGGSQPSPLPRQWPVSPVEKSEKVGAWELATWHFGGPDNPQHIVAQDAGRLLAKRTCRDLGEDLVREVFHGAR